MTALLCFEDVYQTTAQYHVRAPGRVNLIGEHTDYNLGFVLPIAIEQQLCIAMQPRADDCIHITLAPQRQSDSFYLSNITPSQTWIRYAKAAASALAEQHPLQYGFNALINSDLPQGAGLSSSAAFELAILKCLTLSNDLPWDPKSMAKLAQYAENHFVGVNCGIMDQMIIATAKQNHALLLDCQNLSTRYYPLPKELSFVILDTQTRRPLVDSAYNDRRMHCERAANLLGASSLRDIDQPFFLKHQSKLDDKCARYAQHVISENSRVLKAANALQSNDPQQLGVLFNASHTSLRDVFKVSSSHLDTIVKLAQESSGCFGARMTGAGFGGCAIAIVDQRQLAAFNQSITDQYRQHTGLNASLYATTASNAIDHQQSITLG